MRFCLRTKTRQLINYYLKSSRHVSLITFITLAEGSLRLAFARNRGIVCHNMMSHGGLSLFYLPNQIRWSGKVVSLFKIV